MVKSAILVLAVCAAPAGLVFSQPASAPDKPDSDTAKALIEKAKKAGGPMWAGEEHFFCEAPRANTVAPARLASVPDLVSCALLREASYTSAESEARFPDRRRGVERP